MRVKGLILVLVVVAIVAFGIYRVSVKYLSSSADSSSAKTCSEFCNKIVKCESITPIAEEICNTCRRGEDTLSGEAWECLLNLPCSELNENIVVLNCSMM